MSPEASGDVAMDMSVVREATHFPVERGNFGVRRDMLWLRRRCWREAVMQIPARPLTRARGRWRCVRRRVSPLPKDTLISLIKALDPVSCEDETRALKE